MHQAMAQLISLATGFVLDFDAGPHSHTVAGVLALSSVQMREPAGIARVLPRRDGIVQAGSEAWKIAVQFLIGHMVATVLI